MTSTVTLRLEPGDSLEAEGENIALRPLRSASPLRKERGVWVFHGSRKLGTAVTDKVLRDIRAQRSQNSHGTDR